MSSFDKKKFVFFELFINENGKTSGSGFIGIILGLISCAAFIATMVGYFLQLPETTQVMGNVLEMIMAVTILLGVRKVSGDYRASKNVDRDDDRDDDDEVVLVVFMGIASSAKSPNA